MTASLEVCTKDKQRAVVPLFFVSEGMKGADIDNLLQIWTELFAAMKYVRVIRNAEGKDAHPHPHPQANKNMESAQAMILGNCKVTIAKIAARLRKMLLVLGANL
jgi:hypothetical protein